MGTTGGLLISAGLSCTHTVPTMVSTCGGLNRGPKEIHVLMPRTCEYVTLHGRKNFANVIKLRILSWRDYPGLSEWAQYNHRDPPEAGRRVRVREEEGTTRQRSESCKVGPTSREMQGPLGARKGEEDSPLEPPEEHGSADT